MIGLMLALVVAPPAPAPQAVQATLQSCAMEQDRWVCRYQVPNIEIIPFTGDASELELTPRTGPAPSPVPGDTPAGTTPTEVAAAGSEAGILTEREAGLVARCADAGWMSLCLPDDRRAARSLRDRQVAYQTVQRSVTGLLAEDRCEEAIRAALDGGYLGLAREARAFCAASVAEPVNVQAVVPPAS
ncbi:hypothetical protein [Brevundimonas subvibrioides]|jgi:hypothetical protein|uniref:Uncharacterized protein n=1 Tax=Brevundimonas subvibrioides (strain ATCC 15264 / DSM 4735 / LMG 14903 / NBRC 16000 / CB 81) TaxID=633149 RepID=D9QIJ6_BRESC|nr:hypothetical protein [Brevundimonas subvibrioides]ADK99498.1 hypothetical protein Bresu_0184 [Brevundimonas subvibrioides ATCC 15264]